MIKKVAIFCIVLAVVSCGSVTKHNEHIVKLHNVSDLQKDVDKARKQLVKHHPKIYQYIDKEVLDFKFDSIKKSITTPISSQEFFEKIAPVIGSIRQGHLLIIPPFKKLTKEEKVIWNKQKQEFNNLDFEEFNKKIYVSNVIDKKDSLLVGAQVLEIDNEPVYDLVNKVKTYFSSDGYNETLKKRFVKNRFKNCVYVNKGVIDSLNLTFKKGDSIFNQTFRRIAKEESKLDTTKVEIKVKKLTKAERKAKKRKQKEEWRFNDKYGYIKSRKEYTRNFRYIGGDSTIAYMKIRGFSNGSYKEFYKESFAKIDSLKTQNLIIDLRDNTGGRLAEIDELYSYLAKEEYVFISPSEVNSRIPFLKMMMSNTSSFGSKILIGAFSPILLTHNFIKTKKEDGKLFYKFKQSKLKYPKPLAYKGNVYVLINGNSFSASSIISTKLKATKRAFFVGEETGGAYNGTVAGIFKNYKLPISKVIIPIGLMQLETPHKMEPDGYGVKPDIEIIPTLNDRLSRKDPELDWIINDISLKEEASK